jgi:hypothetical protein
MSTIRDRADKWIKPYAALWLTMIIGGGLVLAMALLGAEVYSDVVDDEGLASLDIPALHYAQSLRTPDLDTFVTGFTNIGGGIGMPILASILTAWLTFLRRPWFPPWPLRSANAWWAGRVRIIPRQCHPLRTRRPSPAATP